MVKDKKPYRILVVEDNPGDFIIVEEFLRIQIFNPVVICATNFQEASKILAEGSEFSVILLDLSLPDKSGEPLIVEMLRIAFLCPIIILTGYADIDFSIKSISKGILDYLLKDDLNATVLYKSIIYAIERKKAISVLKESEKRNSDLFQLSPQPMWVYDSTTLRFVQVNQAAVNHYGYSEDEFLTMTIRDIRPQEDMLKINDENDDRISDDDEMYKGKFTHCKKSGDIIEVEIFCTPIELNQRAFGSVIAIDVTEKTLYAHKIMKAIIKTQEDERYEIGGELHDNVCQLLATSQLSLGMLKSTLAPAGMVLFRQSKEYITLALNEIRNLSHRLAPAFFDNTTLEEAFRRLLKTSDGEGKFKILLYFDDAIKKHRISLEIQLNLYRILQEQLRNILKHAKATTIHVDVLVHANTLKMRVTDDGVGFEVHAIKKGTGLANMKRRAELFSGKFEIYSLPGNGCEVIVNIPLGKKGTPTPGSKLR